MPVPADVSILEQAQVPERGDGAVRVGIGATSAGTPFLFAAGVGLGHGVGWTFPLRLAFEDAHGDGWSLASSAGVVGAGWSKDGGLAYAVDTGNELRWRAGDAVLSAGTDARLVQRGTGHAGHVSGELAVELAKTDVHVRMPVGARVQIADRDVPRLVWTFGTLPGDLLLGTPRPEASISVHGHLTLDVYAGFAVTPQTMYQSLELGLGWVW